MLTSHKSSSRKSSSGQSGPRKPLRPSPERGLTSSEPSQGISEDLEGSQQGAAKKSLRITRRRIPELAIGVVLLGLGAIGALLIAGDEPAKVPALIWADDVPRGRDIVAEDLAVVEIDTDSTVGVLTAESASGVIGRRLLFRGSKSEFVNSSLLSEGLSLRANEAIVGMRLTPGQYPGTTLAGGDFVDLILPENRPGWESPVVATGVEVFAVEWMSDGGGDALVSLIIQRSAAARVVEASIAGVRLLEVAA